MEMSGGKELAGRRHTDGRGGANFNCDQYHKPLSCNLIVPIRFIGLIKR